VTVRPEKGKKRFTQQDPLLAKNAVGYKTAKMILLNREFAYTHLRVPGGGNTKTKGSLEKGGGEGFFEAAT